MDGFLVLSVGDIYRIPTDLSEIKVTFDESIDKNSVDTGSLSLFIDSGIGTIPDIDSVSVSSKTATFKLSPSTTGSNTFTPGVNYIASISTNIEDQDGNFLDCFDSKGVDDNCEWNFSIADDNNPPTVSSTIPNSGATGVPVTSSIKATFNKPVQPATVSITTFTLKNSTGASISGLASLSQNGLTATFDPTEPLSSSKSYTATVTTGVKDLAGNALNADKIWSFTTAPLDTSPPTVVSTNPACCDGPTNVPVGDPITARFNEPMDESTITTSTFTLKSADPPADITGEVSVSNDLKTATFVPSSNLSKSTVYLATITTGAKALGGNPMESPFSCHARSFFIMYKIYEY